MKELNENEIEKHDHVLAYIWETTGGGGYGYGHVALKIHDAGNGDKDMMEDTFVSLWPGDDGKKTLLTWQKDYNEVFAAEHNHGPTTMLVFYSLDVLSMVNRFNALKEKTKGWVLMPTKGESLDIESLHNNCCTAAWKVLRAGNNNNSILLPPKKAKKKLSLVRSKFTKEATKQIPQSSSRFFRASIESEDTHHSSMVSGGPSSLSWQAILTGERYGPDMLYEILTEAKLMEVEKMRKDDPNDIRLTIIYPGKVTQTADGIIYEPNNNPKKCGVESEKFTATNIVQTMKANNKTKGKRWK